MKILIPFIFAILLLESTPVNAFWGFTAKSAAKLASISSSKLVLSEKQIINLSKLSSEEQGIKKVGKELARLKLPNHVLEDTYMRIAVHQGKISRKEAEGMYAGLSGVPGFRTTLRKVTGNNPYGTIGHLNELKIAHQAVNNGYEVVHIGEKFSDGIKRSPTDIDIILKKGKQIFIIEAKSYQSLTKVPMDKYRSDLNTLVEYGNKHPDKNTIPIFSITNKPNDLQYINKLHYEADKRGVQLIFGTPAEQIEKITLLGNIL